jgi:uncharacterized protein (DUF427 family)
VGDTEERDLVWRYEEPLRGAERIRDRLCFFNERVDLYVDGRPAVTRCSRAVPR